MFYLSEFPQFALIQNLARSKKIKVYLVGGFLRDYLLGRSGLPATAYPADGGKAGRDFDFALSKNAVSFAKIFSRKIKGAFIVLDEERGCARVAKKEKGVVTTFDFADFRDKTITGDLAHRDFTINALCVDLASLKPSMDFSEALLDPKGGRKDLEAKRIKMVSAKSFKEDPLRLLRAFSLRALLGFRIEPKTLALIRKERDLLRHVSAERIRDEFFKILAASRSAVHLKAMDRLGLLKKVIPQISVMDNCKQGGYHHLDVWPHSLEVVVQLERIYEDLKSNPESLAYLNEAVGGERPRISLLKLAALLHDIGKPDTRKKEGERVSFHGHEGVGKTIVKAIAKMLKLSTRERYVLEDMVFYHLRPGYLSNFKEPSERSIFRYFRDTKEEAASILLLSLADQRSTRGPLTTEADQRHHEAIVMRLVQKYFDKLKEKPLVRLITGDDLIKKLKLKPSPLFAKILSAVEEQQALGQLKTKEEAIKLAAELAE